MDDIPTGDETEEGREEQISQVVAVLDKIKLSLKSITRSGEKPGKSTKMLGYKWFTEQALFAPGLSELNLNKKIRGGKRPNEIPVVTYTDTARLLQGLELTWRDVVAKVAEFFSSYWNVGTS